MRRTYIDNIRWITVALVVIYHVIYMFNGVTLYGVIGPFSDHQPQDMYQYIVYPWFMVLLFTISGRILTPASSVLVGISHFSRSSPSSEKSPIFTVVPPTSTPM